MQSHQQDTVIDTLMKIKPLLKKEMMANLDKKSKWTYLHIPPNKAEEAVHEKIKSFIETKLDKWITLCHNVLPHFTQKDSESIGTSSLTTNAQKFIGLVEYLEKHGFPGVNDYNKKINFWSGESAKKKALAIEDELSDSKIPSISAMFNLCRAIQQTQGHYSQFITLLTSSVSRIFAAHASESVSVYLSSEKALEPAGLTTPNNFWLAELPTLMTLHKEGKIQNIFIHRYDHQKNQWKKPIDLFSPQGEMLPLRRRNYHKLDNQNHITLFKSLSMTSNDRKAWQDSVPRPAITFGKLKRITLKWHELAKEKSDLRLNK